jgi:protein-S-isoprenylcysteine O-methyltransferase Ste14
MNKLIIQVLKTAVLGIIALGILLFIPAGTLNYWQAWVFIAAFVVSTNVIGLYLLFHDPELLKRRQNFGPAAERNTTQKIIASVLILGSVGVLVFCALDHRFGWSPVPPAVSIIGDALVALGLLMNLAVLKENSYSSANIRTFQGQKVISTGPYALVRHPMYTGVLVMMLGMPLALDSRWGLVILALILPALALRILDEEKLLKRDLAGYLAYTHKVRYRLVPYLW